MDPLASPFPLQSTNSPVAADVSKSFLIMVLHFGGQQATSLDTSFLAQLISPFFPPSLSGQQLNACLFESRSRSRKETNKLGI
jgi:hypothetical protein